MVEMECLDGARIAERSRNLRRLRGKVRSQSLPHPDHFEKIAAVIGPDVVGLDTHASDQIGRIDRPDHVADALIAVGRGNANGFRRGAHCIPGYRESGTCRYSATRSMLP